MQGQTMYIYEQWRSFGVYGCGRKCPVFRRREGLFRLPRPLPFLHYFEISGLFSVAVQSEVVSLAKLWCSGRLRLELLSSWTPSWQVFDCSWASLRWPLISYTWASSKSSRVGLWWTWKWQRKLGALFLKSSWATYQGSRFRDPSLIHKIKQSLRVFNIC